MSINLIPLSFKIFPLKHKMFCKVKTFNLLYFSTAKYIFRNQNNSYLKQVSKKRIPLSYKILPLSHKMFWKCDIIDILLIHSIKNTSGTSNAHTCQVAWLPEGGESFSFTTLKGDFKNSKVASYFYHLGRPITKTMLIKTLFIFNQQ